MPLTLVTVISYLLLTLLFFQVNNLLQVAQKYQAVASESGSAGISNNDAQTICNMLVIPYFTFSTWHWHPHVLSKIFWLSNWCGYIFFFCTVRFVTASRQLAKNLEHHTLNEHGLSKRYVRCLQVVWIPPCFFLQFKYIHMHAASDGCLYLSDIGGGESHEGLDWVQPQEQSWS